MNNFFASLPRATLVFIALVGGTLFIVLSDPPKTACDAQADKLMEELKSLLLPNTVAKSTSKSTRYSKLVNRCKSTNSPGGCYEYFAQIRNILNAVKKVEPNCYSEAASKGPIRQSMWQSADLMVRLAWGEKPPINYYEKMGWLQYSDINLFCLLKNKLIDLYGQQAWGDFRERMMKSLPGSDQLPREKIWNGMIVSLDCSKFQ